MPEQRPAQAATHSGDLADRLRVLVEHLTEAYESLDRIAEERRQAVVSADLRALAECVRAENEQVQHIARLDADRGAIVREAAQGTRLDPASTTLTQVARTISEPRRSAILDAARRLRLLIEQVQRKNNSAKAALDKLSRHMQGLLRAAESRHSHSGAYGRSGTVRVGAPVVTALDCVS